MRLALVTARFWPLAGEPESQLLSLAEQFRRAGHEVTVATAAWDSAWPARVWVREIAVCRVRGAPHGSFRTMRYLFNLGRWFREHRTDFDLVLVVGLQYEAYIALGTAHAWSVPVVLLVATADPQGELYWHRTAPFGQRVLRRCHRAEQIVIPSPQVAAELIAAGFPRERVTTIVPGIPLPPPATPSRRVAARKALADANLDLRTSADCPVVVASGRFVATSGFEVLIQAWPAVAAKFPTARLWIAGDGPQRERLWSLIGDLDLRARVFLPGTFSPRDELSQAADLFVAPATADGPAWELAQALAFGLPCIATDTTTHREWVESERTGLIVNTGSSSDLAAALCRLLANPADGVRLGAAARQEVGTRHSEARSVEQFLQLFERLRP